MSQDPTIAGACLCGDIRYEVPAQSEFQLLCHCTDCQTISGAGGYAAYVVPLDAVSVTQGNPSSYEVTADSGRTNRRRFCSTCGTRVWAELPEMGMASVNGLSLINREHYRPKMHHMPESAPSWCNLESF